MVCLTPSWWLRALLRRGCWCVDAMVSTATTGCSELGVGGIGARPLLEPALGASTSKWSTSGLPLRLGLEVARTADRCCSLM